jgi:hypothetical protein
MIDSQGNPGIGGRAKGVVIELDEDDVTGVVLSEVDVLT